MTKERIQDLVKFELKIMEWGVTEQFMEIHSPVLFHNSVQIDNVAVTQNKISVFVPVENERFYLVFYIDSDKDQITGISTEPDIEIYFKATSAVLSETELKQYTHLEISESWNKGDIKQSGKTSHTSSGIIIEPNKKPNDFESKLNELISELKKDKGGIEALSKNADGYIQVLMNYHNGNGMVGGPNLNEMNIKDLNDLGLSIDFNFNVSGNLYRS